MVPPLSHHILSDHPNKVRMFVLETDEPHADTSKEKGSFGEVLDVLFKEAGDEHNPTLGIETVMQYVVEDNGGKVPQFEEIGKDIHAILITGSVYDAHGNDKWIIKLIKLIERIWVERPDIRFTGICFGHQILCRTLGSTVQAAPESEWELSHTAITLSDIGRSLFDLPNAEDKIHLHQMHVDHVVKPPSAEKSKLLKNGTKIHVWGSSEHTEVQGVYIHKRLFTTQGHMEFTEIMVKRQLEMRVEAGNLGKEEADEARERAEWKHDGLLVAKAVLRFFHGDDDDII